MKNCDYIKYRYLHIATGQFDDHSGMSVGANGRCGGGPAFPF